MRRFFYLRKPRAEMPPSLRRLARGRHPILCKSKVQPCFCTDLMVKSTPKKTGKNLMIARSIATTAKEWISLLEASYIIRTLRPYYRNFGKRFIKAPKIYFIETGLACNLLGIKSTEQVASHPLVGNLFENMVVMEAFKRRLNRGESDDLYFMRTTTKSISPCPGFFW